MQAERGLFFTSIPKGGKNLIYSFLDELGYQRPRLPREEALWHVEEPWLAKAGRACTYALPPSPLALQPGLRAGFEAFLTAASVLPVREVLHHHFPYNDELARELRRAGVPVVFVKRDPRDLLLSMADYILVQQKPVHLATRFRGLDREDLVVRLWTGDESLLSLCDYYAAFADWRSAPGVLTLDFESLVGEAGGGDSRLQTDALRKLVDVLAPVDEAVFARATSKTFNRRAGTFFKGKQGRWRDETAPRIRAVFDSPAMQELARGWGYGTGVGIQAAR